MRVTVLDLSMYAAPQHHLLITEKRSVFFMTAERSDWYEMREQSPGRAALKLLDLLSIAESEDVIIFINPKVVTYPTWNDFVHHLKNQFPADRRVSLATNESVFARYLENLFQKK